MVLIHPEYALLLIEINELKNEIANLIVERDWLIYYACKEVRIDYTLKIGSLEYKLYIKGKKYTKNLRKLEIIKDLQSKNIEVDMESIEKQVDNEFKKMDKSEKEMLGDLDYAIEMSSIDYLDDEILEEMSDDYYKLQKMYNPIFDFSQDEEKKKMYKKIKRYYEKGNYKKLKKLAENYDENDVLQDEIENLKIIKEKYLEIEEIYEKEIRKIRNSFPFNQRTILEDDSLCRRKKDKLNREIIEIDLENKKIEKKIKNLLKKKK